MSHRLLAMRLSPSAVEHVLIHGLADKPPLDTLVDWQVDPRSVPEAGCVDMQALVRMVANSPPPPSPFALFAGRAAWEQLMNGIVEEALTERETCAAASRRALDRRWCAGDLTGRDLGSAAAAAAAAVAKERAAAELAAAERVAVGGGLAVAQPTAAGEAIQTRLLLICRVLAPPTDATGGGRAGAALPGTATADAERILPLYLLHYGISTTPVPSVPAGFLSPLLPISEKAVPAPQQEAAREPSRGGSKGSAGGKGSTRHRVGRSGCADEAEPSPEPSLLNPALRSTREHAAVITCQRITADRMLEVANMFAASIEAMRAQLTPSRSQALVDDALREAELHVLIADARTELTRLKKVNRELASELQTTY